MSDDAIASELYTRASPSGEASADEVAAPDPGPEQARAAIEAGTLGLTGEGGPSRWQGVKP